MRHTHTRKHTCTHTHTHLHMLTHTLMVMKIMSLCYYYRKAWQIYIVICLFCFILICPLGLISILLLFPFLDMFIYLLMHFYRCFSLAERLMPAIWAAKLLQLYLSIKIELIVVLIFIFFCKEHKPN